MRSCAAWLIVALSVGAGASSDALAVDPLPGEPVEIGADPQFVFDNYVVDNHWAIRYKREAVERVFHPPVKYAGNPVIEGHGGYACVDRDDGGLFRIWYQTWQAGEEGRSGKYALAYAESDNGIDWRRPRLGLFSWQGSRDNNIVWLGRHGRRASSPFLLDLPEADRRGYRYVFLYRETDGMRLIGSQDGIHFDAASDTRISPIHSDTQNALVWDPRRQEYVIFCRAKHIYRTFRGQVLDTGASRRVARMANSKLWELWDRQPQNILIPDELDGRENFNFFYGMPRRYYGGVYWGFLQVFKMNSDIHAELATSRDGFHFQRLPGRPKLIARGEEGAWDDGMVFSGYQWIEMGDQWWMYYAGWDGPHGTRERTPGIGLVQLRKEGLISLRGPAGGGVVATRALRWPGGQLVVNADARGGEFKVRVTDAARKPLPGFDYDDCRAFADDDVAHQVTWQGTSADALGNQVIRLEFFLRNADLYTFRAQ